MKITIVILLISHLGFCQSFTRSELPTILSNPWEMTYGPDNFLWITESQGKVSRVNPNTGEKQIVYTAPDYYDGSPAEALTTCFKPKIGSGTLGLALDPNFLQAGNSFVYFYYSYNSGNQANPKTRFKISKLTWDANVGQVTNAIDIATFPSGYEHLGGRLIIAGNAPQHYIFVSIGDYGPSEITASQCFLPQSLNPNNLTQDPFTANGKIHRLNLDGTIPSDNPIKGNSFYTRGHRNPQGLMYNSDKNILYDVEHGDITDDELNVLVAGMNYGWKTVRGYHDGNYAEELDYINSYSPNPNILNDRLIAPIYTWCNTTLPTDSNNFPGYCTIAPSDGIFYKSNAISDFTNSLLIVTLKNGETTDQQVFRLKLSYDGKSLAPSTTDNPNPKKLFGSDQALNGRLRDIAISPDGKTIFLINNDFNIPQRIIKYKFESETGIEKDNSPIDIKIYPNPSSNHISIQCNEAIQNIRILNIFGQTMNIDYSNISDINVSMLNRGYYVVKVKIKNQDFVSNLIIE
ncbi:MAG: PQQ-dependent sugar dehydrogenase [Opitutaceae bacterium]|nr:PQQ-dependent sugar dehydrogenase [Cytophagales bacterium]